MTASMSFTVTGVTVVGVLLVFRCRYNQNGLLFRYNVHFLD